MVAYVYVYKMTTGIEWISNTAYDSITAALDAATGSSQTRKGKLESVTVGEDFEMWEKNPT